ncbi:nucleoside/nucleotide kinase family protein [Bounagaea algeriensis]
MPFGELLARARALIETGQRRILGIAGPPGCGKSTAAQAVARALRPHAVVVPMDGFHLAQAELRRLGLRDRMGAPDTFDVAGYTALLRRLRWNAEELVHAPGFDRDIEEPVAAAIAVPVRTPLVITEGNYLLLDREPWSAVRALLDEAWFLAPDEELRRERLVSRHVRCGSSRQRACAWVREVDEGNASLVAAHRAHADLVVRGDPLEGAVTG